MRSRWVARCATGCLLTAVWAVSAPAAAQTAGEEPVGRVRFMPRTVFHMTAERLSLDDPRFEWEANFGGEVDIVDYGVGRFAFWANYQVVIGDEIRIFDPNQGNYILAGLLSARLGETEVAGVLYHQSRHLSDRANVIAVAWNAMGGQVRRRFSVDRATLDARADVRRVIAKATVDYDWEIDAGVRGDAPIRAGVGVLAAANLRHVGMDGTAGRDGETGYRLEGGVRFEGRRGAVELFVAAERRVDPYPLELSTAQWLSAGFRLMSR